MCLLINSRKRTRVHFKNMWRATLLLCGSLITTFNWAKENWIKKREVERTQGKEERKRKEEEKKKKKGRRKNIRKGKEEGKEEGMERDRSKQVSSKVKLRANATDNAPWRRLHSVMINLFRLLLYQCFVNILQLSAARTSYQYNSSQKELHCSHAYRDTDFTGSFSFAFLQHYSNHFLFHSCFVCLALNMPHHFNSADICPRGEEVIWEKSVPSCRVQIFGMCVGHSSSMW